MATQPEATTVLQTIYQKNKIIHTQLTEVEREIREMKELNSLKLDQFSCVNSLSEEVRSFFSSRFNFLYLPNERKQEIQIVFETFLRHLHRHLPLTHSWNAPNLPPLQAASVASVAASEEASALPRLQLP